MYNKVYTPDGEMFEVPRHIFEDVILNKGWTQTKPVESPKTLKAPEKVVKNKATDVIRPKSSKKFEDKPDD